MAVLEGPPKAEGGQAKSGLWSVFCYLRPDDTIEAEG